MKALGPFEIDLKALENQVTDFEYELDDAYFGTLEEAMVHEGKVKARVRVRKVSGHFEVDLSVSGAVQVTCDRCLDPMEQPIENSGRLTVRFGDAYEEVDDQLLILPEMPGTLNVSWYLYELVVLAIPLRHVHEEGSCDAGMRERLEGMTPGGGDETDPRWDVLKRLKEE